jgi:prevent-host-death family protein
MKHTPNTGCSAELVQRHIVQEDLFMKIADIRNNLADAINRVAYGRERILLERRGKKVAALVPVEDVELLEELEDQADIRAAKKALKEKGGITLEELKKKYGI